MRNGDRIILDLCGGTGSWSAPYREAGYDVRVVTMPEQDVRSFVPPYKDRVVQPEVIRDSVRGRFYAPWHMKSGGASEKTKRLRSITPPGFARAFFEVNP